MCDYSLHDVASRPAKVGDELVTTAFANSATCGLCTVGETEVAVCLMPGTELAFASEAEYSHPFQRLLPKFGFGKIGARAARFRRVNTEYPTMHHDALEFANGRVVLVHLLRPGQRATVLQLPVTGRAANPPVKEKANERVAT
jgi:hypothetical protein